LELLADLGLGEANRPLPRLYVLPDRHLLCAAIERELVVTWLDLDDWGAELDLLFGLDQEAAIGHGHDDRVHLAGRGSAAREVAAERNGDAAEDAHNDLLAHL
jgi:hypothetical protein